MLVTALNPSPTLQYQPPPSRSIGFEEEEDRFEPAPLPEVAEVPPPPLKPGPLARAAASAAVIVTAGGICAGVVSQVLSLDILNPVIAENLPDPGVIEVDGIYYTVTTSGNGANSFPIRSSTDLQNWEFEGHIFPDGQRPAWTTGDFWAPEIHRVGDRFVVYYTARDTTGKLCIGAAVSNEVDGPYTDLGRPLLRSDRVGLIDATYFKDEDGRHYIAWKEDGNAIGAPTPILLQELGADGLSVTGPVTEMITNDLGWEGDLVEAPWIVKRGEYYYCFYSANAFYDERYAVGVARSKSLTGEWEKLPDPILHSDEHWAGPGHGSVVQGPDGEDYFVYHSWAQGHAGRGRGNMRMLLVDKIEWGPDGWPRIHDGTPSGEPPAEYLARAA